jgi:CRISPR-associated protein Cmr4
LKHDLSLLPNVRFDVPTINPTGPDKYISLVGGIKERPVVLEDLAVSEEASPPDVNGLSHVFKTLAPQVSRLLLVSDQNFSFLAQSATEIQPQIRINLETGTADDGSLRYQELLPADSVLYSLVFLTKERVRGERLMAQVIKGYLLQAISTHIQMGGDFTLGRGLMEITWYPKENKGEPNA